MYPLKQSTAFTIPFFVHDVAGDAVTGATFAGVKRISKGSGAFAAITATTAELDNGWYTIALTATHTDTLGLLSLMIIPSSGKQVNLQFRVHVRIPDDLAFPATTGRSIQVETDGMVHADLKEWLGTAPLVLVSQRVNASVGAIAANVITAASINAAALNGKGDWNIGKTGYTLTQTFPTNFADFSITATSGLVTLAAVTHTGAIIPTTTAVTNAVTVGTINANVITASSINANAITSAKIATNAIGASQMATGAIATGVIDATARDEIADSHLNRDMSAVTVTNTRSPINCLRFLRNKWSIAANVLTVTEEDDTTTAWTSTLVGTAGADPITSSDPT